MCINLQREGGSEEKKATIAKKMKILKVKWMGQTMKGLKREEDRERCLVKTSKASLTLK